MEFNRFVFPAPSPKYTPHSLDKLIWVPKTRFFSMKGLLKSSHKFEDFQTPNPENSPRLRTNQSEQVYIPCHYQDYGKGEKNLILYFHGNAEDIGSASLFTRQLAMELKTKILAVEYPGYGVYEGQPSAKVINEDAEIVFDFLVHEVGIEPQNILVFGRSIGSGPATHLAANRCPGSLVLMSPYTSIQSVIKDIVGAFLSGLVAERFNNIEEIAKAECPCFFIHGKKDKVISYQHSKILYEKCQAQAGICLSETMSHNNFRLTSDITNPLKKFLNRLGFMGRVGSIEFPKYVFRVPVKEYQPKGGDLTSKIMQNIVTD